IFADIHNDARVDQIPLKFSIGLIWVDIGGLEKSLLVQITSANRVSRDTTPAANGHIVGGNRRAIFKESIVPVHVRMTNGIRPISECSEVFISVDGSPAIVLKGLVQ